MKIKLTFIVAILIMFLLSNSCNNRKQEQIETQLQSYKEMEVMKNKIINDGDTTSYNELIVRCVSKRIFKDVIGYSLFMANNCHYPKAYYDVYAIQKVTMPNLQEIEEDLASKYLNLYFLMKSKEMGYKVSDHEISIHFGDSISTASQILTRWAKAEEKFGTQNKK